MKLTTKIVTLTITMMLIGQSYMIHVNNMSSKLERKNKNKKNNPTAKVTEEEHTVVPFGKDDDRFMILGDTGQVDKYFDDFIKRSLDTTIAAVDKTETGAYANFQALLDAAVAAKVPKFNQAVILGDFLYTENKKGGIILEDSSKWPTDPVQLKAYKKPVYYKDVKTEVTAQFETRLAKQTDVLNKLLPTYDKLAPFWMVLSGNHSYDVDAASERLFMSKDENKVKMYKHSKVHISKHVCFGDFSFGDLVCLGKTYTECLKGALGAARYGRNEAETLASLEKLVEAILTLKMCKTKWRVIRTHAAPFNSEVDAHYLFSPIKAKITCTIRDTFDELKLATTDVKTVAELDKLIDEAAKLDLTYDLLKAKSLGQTANKKTDKVENRVFKCTAVEDKAASHASVMEMINYAHPHFYLGSHLHASQVLVAHNTLTYPEPERKTSKEFNDIAGCKELNYLAKLGDLKADKTTYTANEFTNCSDSATEVTFEIKKLKPEYNLIFVIGNSGRFLDPFFDGSQSRSHIAWQRINAGGKDEKNKLAFNLYSKATSKTPDKTITAQQILDAEKKTAYGYAEFVTLSADKATIEFKELDKSGTAPKLQTVLKVNLSKENDKTLPAYGSAAAEKKLG